MTLFRYLVILNNKMLLLKLKQKDLSEKTGLSVSTISGIFNGKAGNIEDLKIIENSLNKIEGLETENLEIDEIIEDLKKKIKFVCKVDFESENKQLIIARNKIISEKLDISIKMVNNLFKNNYSVKGIINIENKINKLLEVENG